MVDRDESGALTGSADLAGHWPVRGFEECPDLHYHRGVREMKARQDNPTEAFIILQRYFFVRICV